MLVSLRREYANLITSGAQLLLLFIGLQMESRNGWFLSLGLVAIISILAWLSALARFRAIRDTPTSRIASAAQGYVELYGRGKPFTEVPLLSKLRQQPCLWYRYKIEQREEKDGWKTLEHGESWDSFVLYDDSGECEVNPEAAEIVTEHHEQWHEGDFRYTEWKLLGSDRLYILGEFRTQSTAIAFDSHAELNALLSEWKQDKSTLVERFDLNRDGELDMDEWMLARQEAKRVVAKKQLEAQQLPDTHQIDRPKNGKLFLISNLTQEKLSHRYLRWAYVHVIIFLGTLAGLGWVLQHGKF